MSNLEFFKSSSDLPRHSNITSRTKKYQIFNVQTDYKNLNIKNIFCDFLNTYYYFLNIN